MPFELFAFSSSFMFDFLNIESSHACYTMWICTTNHMQNLCTFLFWIGVLVVKEKSFINVRICANHKFARSAFHQLSHSCVMLCDAYSYAFRILSLTHSLSPPFKLWWNAVSSSLHGNRVNHFLFPRIREPGYYQYLVYFKVKYIRFTWHLINTIRFACTCHCTCV